VLFTLLSKGTMTSGRLSHTATSLGTSNVLICGGHDIVGTAVASCELYNVASGIFSATGTLLLLGLSFSLLFSTKGSLTAARESHTATVLSTNNVLACGGINGVSQASCNVYDVCFGFGTAGTPPLGCVNTVIHLNAQNGQPLTNGVGLWASAPGLAFSNVTDPRATFAVTVASSFSVSWRSPFCSSSVNITTLAPPVAQFPSPQITIPAGKGCSQFTLKVILLGDATSGGGVWTVPAGSVSPPTGPITQFSWVPAQVGTTFNVSFTPNSVCNTPVNLTVTLTNDTCTNTCIGFTANVPANGCINTPVPISGTFDGVSGPGQWSSPGSSLVTIANPTPNSALTSNMNGTITIVWSSANCQVTKTVTIVSPPTAVIPPLSQQLCGPSGSANVGARLSGDAIFGTWTATPASTASFDNTVPAFTLFSWNQPGTYTLQFTPNSVCNAAATLTVQIDAQCPQVLSREATIGIGVGATLGGLILVAAGVLAAVKIYQAWNRRVVQFRDKDVPLAQSDYYKF
jgi:hypothetical protein